MLAIRLVETNFADRHISILILREQRALVAWSPKVGWKLSKINRYLVIGTMGSLYNKWYAHLPTS